MMLNSIVLAAYPSRSILSNILIIIMQCLIGNRHTLVRFLQEYFSEKQAAEKGTAKDEKVNVY